MSYLQSALAVAIVNIQIPLLLGDVVNVVSKFTAESTGNFMEEIRHPAIRLISLYGFQVREIKIEPWIYLCHVLLQPIGSSNWLSVSDLNQSWFDLVYPICKKI